MSPFFAFVIAAAKTSQAFRDILDQFVRLYSAARIQWNNDAKAAKDARNDAAVDSAAGAAFADGLCPICHGPYPGEGSGQHGGADSAPGLPKSGGGGS